MIRLVSTSCVPVAVNLYKVRVAKDAGGDLFRSVQRQKDQYQGIWIVSPDGRVLAGHHDIQDHKTWAQKVLATVRSGLQAFGDVAPRADQLESADPLPYRGKGVGGDGRVTLAVYTRYMHNGRADGPAVIDSVELNRDDWAGFAPPAAVPGTEWSLPETAARKFSRVLSPSSDQSTMPRPQEVTQAELTARVEKVQDGIAHLTFTGILAAEHRSDGKLSTGQAQLRGEGTYDLQSKQIRSIHWVFDGTHRSPPPYDSPRQTGAVVEWVADPSAP